MRSSDTDRTIERDELFRLIDLYDRGFKAAIDDLPIALRSNYIAIISRLRKMAKFQQVIEVTTDAGQKRQMLVEVR